MRYSYPTNLTMHRNRNAEAVKGALLFGGLTLLIVGVIVMSLDVPIDPQLSCYQSAEGLNCKVD